MKTPVPILGILLLFPGCDREGKRGAGRELPRAEDGYATVVYECRAGYMNALAQKVSERTNDPSIAPPSGNASWNPSPKRLLQRVGLSADEGSAFFFNYAESTFLFTADRAGHAEFLALHAELGIEIVPRGEPGVAAEP